MTRPPRDLTKELLDLLVLMPDSQLDEIVNFAKVLRSARAIRDGKPDPLRCPNCGYTDPAPAHTVGLAQSAEDSQP